MKATEENLFNKVPPGRVDYQFNPPPAVIPLFALFSNGGHPDVYRDRFSPPYWIESWL
jgi:hypothetical protein